MALAESNWLTEVSNLHDVTARYQRLTGELPADADAQADDALMQCSTELPPVMTLDKDKLATVDITQPAPPLVRATATPIAVDASDCSKTSATIDARSGAWNRKDFASYLGSYSDKFVPPQGMTRVAWEALRKKRLSKPGSLTTAISHIKPLACSGGTADVAFTQTYGSDDYCDVVEKTLSMALVKGAWKITRESVTKGRTF